MSNTHASAIASALLDGLGGRYLPLRESALEACGHLLIATNLTRVGPFGIKAQQFYTSTELGAMTGHVSELAY